MLWAIEIKHLLASVTYYNPKGESESLNKPLQ